MRGIRATAAVIACLGGCSFRSPGASDVDPDAAELDAAEAAPDAYVPACMTAPAYMANPATGRRYRWHPTAVNYDAAIDACAADGAHLAVVDDLAENTYLDGRINAEAWIGFDDLTQEGVYKWVTGAAGFNHYTPPEPNNFNNEDCTALRTDGTWHDAGCEDSRRPLCECDPAYRPPPKPRCRTMTASSFEASGRRVFRGPLATWPQAKLACDAIGAHLLVIGDLAENAEMDTALSGAYWIGYTDAVEEGSFRWVNSSPSTYQAWPGGTAPREDLEDCAVLQDGGAWATIDCEMMIPYACECDPAPP